MNLASVPDTVLRQFERINFGNTTSTVQLSLNDVLTMTSGNAVENVLRIDSTRTSGGGTVNLQTQGLTLQSPAANTTILDVDGTNNLTVCASGASGATITVTSNYNNSSAPDVKINNRAYDVYRYDFYDYTTSTTKAVTLLIDVAINTVVI